MTVAQISQRVVIFCNNHKLESSTDISENILPIFKQIYKNKTENFSVYKQSKKWLHFDWLLTAFWLIFDWILTAFWLNFDCILAAFYLYFDWILTAFWLHCNRILTAFWRDFDCILIAFWLHFDWILAALIEFWLNFDWISTEFWTLIQKELAPKIKHSISNIDSSQRLAKFLKIPKNSTKIFIHSKTWFIRCKMRKWFSSLKHSSC